MKASLEVSVAGLLIGHQLAFFLTLGGLVLLVLLAMVLVLWRAKRRGLAEATAEAIAAPMPAPDETNVAPQPQAQTTPWRMWRAFRRGLRAYRRVAGQLNGIYTAPWYLILGSEGCGKSALLAAIGPNEPPTLTLDPQGGAPVGCAWWLYDEAVIIEVPGHVTRAGNSISDGAWHMLLRLLRWHRPRRPLDGVVVAVALTDLLGATQLDPTALRQKALLLQRRLFQVQSALGFCLPVHVVLTHCDALPGFTELADALPPTLRNAMFGWSNPFALDAVYCSAWLATGLEEMNAALLQTQLELHAAGALEASADKLFELHGHLQALQEPLDHFLGAVFRRTVFQESLFFRGFYLTAAASDPLVPPREALFAAPAFRQKIFLERDLSRPTPAFAMGAGRRRRVAQAVAAVAGLALFGGIWREGERASAWRDHIVPVLRSVTAAEGGPEARVRRFSADIAALPPPFTSLLLPGSWLGTTNDRVKEALALGYQRTLLGLSRERLEQALQQLVAPAPAAPEGGELDQFRAYVERVGAVEEDVAQFDAVAADPAGKQLPALLSRVWGIDLPEDFLAHVDAWHMAEPHIENVPASATGRQPIALAAFHAASIARLEQLSDAAYDRLAGGGPAAALLSRVALDLEAARQPNGKVEPVIAALADARDGLHEAAPQVGTDPDSWAGARTFTFSPGVQAIFDAIGRSALLGPAERDRIIAQARRRFAASNEALRTADSVIGPLLTRDKSGETMLTPIAVNLETALSSWLNRAFLITATSVPRNEAPGWNTQMLTPAGALTEDYLTFEVRDLTTFPPILQPAIRNISRLRLQQNLLDIVLRANGSGVVEATEGGLHDQIMRLAAAAPRLADVSRTLGQIGADSAQAQLRDLVYQQARMLLGAVDRLLTQDALYQPSQAALQAAWQQALPNYLLFAQPDAANLEQMLGMARARIATLARKLAAPLLTVLAMPEFNHPAQGSDETRWAATIAELDKFDAERPGNAILALEKFILVDLADATKLCPTLSAADIGIYGNDIFSLRRRQLRTALATQCSRLGGARLASGYTEIAEAFDRLLAGRYPFARAGAPDVSAYALLSFYDTFDRNLPRLTAVTSPDPASPANPIMASFINTLQAARPLVAPAIATGENVSLQVDVHFRTNRNAEQGGDQIIEWRFTSGVVTVSSLEPHKQVVWHPGDPVQLMLRWAKDGHTSPLTAAPGVGHVDGQTLTFRFATGWALLSMLQDLRAESTLPGDGSSAVIALPFQTHETLPPIKAESARKQAADVPTHDSPGRVFATFSLHRLAATADDKAAVAQRLLLPHFPTEAPPLDIASNSLPAFSRFAPSSLPSGVFLPPLRGPNSVPGNSAAHGAIASE